jgi:hypothetical protein
MAKELTLRSSTRGVLVPARIEQAFHLGGERSSSTPRGRMRGQELRLALALDLDDPACVGFALDFAGQGARVTASARGPSGALLTWAFHAIASTLSCELRLEDTVIAPAPEPHRAAALAYLAQYETEVRDDEDVSGDAFVKWLAREEHVELSANASFEDLPMDDAEQLYELLLESAGVVDVFLSERELARLLERFKARRPAG